MFDGIREDGRPLIMGIVNVTPDSFSDGGCNATPETACEHARRLRADGADIIDVGGESTRPGAGDIEPAIQLERILPVLRRLVTELGRSVPLSVDTRSAEVAAAALGAGATFINDISAGSDPAMFDCAARARAGIVLMHMQGTPQTMQDDPSYADVVTEVCDFLVERAEAAVAAGVPRRHIAIDPGIGFGKTRVHNLQLLANLERLVATGYPVMLGTSRKRFMGAICAETDPGRLVGATCATTAMGVAAGVRLFRVHDVRENRQAADVASACAVMRTAG